MKVLQSFNKKTKAWVKYKKYSNGKTVVTDVKQKEPGKKFKGVPVKKKK